MDNKIFQDIYDKIASFIPSEWERIVIYLEYGEESYSYSFYVKKSGEYIKCFDLPELSEEELFSMFRDIDGIVSAERNKESELWSNMTMIVEPTGKMHTDFDYTDLSGGTYKYNKKWREKYLV